MVRAIGFGEVNWGLRRDCVKRHLTGGDSAKNGGPFTVLTREAAQGLAGLLH
jgi:hypothetical protein